MAIQMNVAQILTGEGQNRAYEHEFALNAPGNSDWLLIPDKIREIEVQIIFTGGASGKIQKTDDKVDVVKNGSPTPQDWIFGTITNNRIEVAYPSTAIRIVQETAGTMTVKVRSQ